jgi:hypothetical protein
VHTIQALCWRRTALGASHMPAQAIRGGRRQTGTALCACVVPASTGRVGAAAGTRQQPSACSASPSICHSPFPVGARQQWQWDLPLLRVVACVRNPVCAAAGACVCPPGQSHGCCGKGCCPQVMACGESPPEAGRSAGAGASLVGREHQCICYTLEKSRCICAMCVKSWCRDGHQPLG